ncbi:hypothetical protein KsCSTR_08310 [Candidatus Kuenenia stuttgartiensis]|uniref:Uncharacterized protein n=1 Tax=Kuenenia stuttgartiensis TaxID=174633 RepID=Q1PZ95_KUEST|nr:hypothetical protein KsCSTR_08310 [Candidatus Kuenenia stuttgartiensis]CAJ72413.1 unknown protein [Candidatus Kuenenia stuttgartiensis]
MEKSHLLQQIDDMANRLVSFNKPIKLDFRAKFGLPVEKNTEQHKSQGYTKENQKGFNSSKLYCSKEMDLFIA